MTEFLLFDNEGRLTPPHDPLNPRIDEPTPVEMVASLTRPQREQRVKKLMQQAYSIYDMALAERLDGRELAATCILFSGGNDSTTLAHLFRHRSTHAIHANTTIGIEETRQYVRDTCADWGLPLIEERADDSYADLVLGRVKTKKGEDVWPGGFPGPGAHGLMYMRLKERALDKARHTLGIANSRKRAAVFVAGRRRAESKRRENIRLHESDGTVIWVTPLANWHKLDMTTYRLMMAGADAPVPVNRVSELLHMSGECLCGAFATPGELEEIRFWFPDVAAEIDALAERVSAEGIAAREHCTWGHGLGKPSAVGRLCSSCDDRFQLAFFEETV